MLVDSEQQEQRRVGWLVNAEGEYLLPLEGARGAGEEEESGSIMYAPPQQQNLLTAELSTHTAAARPNQGHVHSPTSCRPLSCRAVVLARLLNFQ